MGYFAHYPPLEAVNAIQMMVGMTQHETEDVSSLP